MNYNPVSRRFFLKGLGGAGLMLPFLPSLLPRALWGATAQPPVRYLQFMSAYGVFPDTYFGGTADQGLIQQTGGISGKLLSSISGPMSPLFGTPFDAFRGKMSLVRGLNVLAGSSLHNGSYPTCASGTPEDNQNNGRPVFPWSLDTVISQSSKVYPDATGKQRIVNITPVASSYPNFSWINSNGSVQHVPYIDGSASLLAQFAQLSGSAPPSAQDPSQVRKSDVIQAVFNDYKSVRDSGKLGAADRARFESYMALIDKVQKDLAASTAPAAACSPPAKESELDSAAIHRNHANILVAALACGLTNVASYTLSAENGEAMHTYVHNGVVDQAAITMIQMSAHIAYVMKLMDSVQETSGTLLDNSILYWGDEFGELNGPQGAHTAQDLTALVAGGGAGKLQMGYLLDYRKSGGAPMNNFLITLMNAMGLASSDYEREGVVGFGEYNQNMINNFNLGAFVASSATRRAPLPFLYKGPNLG